MYDNPSTTFISYTGQPEPTREIITTHKLDAVHFKLFPAPKVLNDVPLVHPLGYQG